MSDRYDLPKIKPEVPPTILNAEAGKWAWLSGLAASIASFPFFMKDAFKTGALASTEEAIAKVESHSKKAILIVGSAEIIGGIIGGLSGKQQQEKEQIEGRVVKTPGYFNKGILGGGVIGGLITAPFTMKSPRLGPLAAIPVIGAIIGSIMRKNSLQHDFDKAIAIRDGNHLVTQGLLQQVAANMPAQVQAPVQAVSFKNSVSADEAALLDAKQNEPVKHTEKTQAPAATHEEHATAEASAPVARRA